jgi:hypothetical protein
VRGAWCNELQKSRCDAIEIRQNVIVPEAQNGEAFTAEPVVAGGIGSLSRMLTTVNFDHNSLLEGQEVRDIAAERNLPPELGAGESPVAKQVPELALGIGHATA